MQIGLRKFGPGRRLSGRSSEAPMNGKTAYVRARLLQRRNPNFFALLIVSAVLSGTLVWTRNSAPSSPDLGKGRLAADRFLELLRKGQAGIAWDSTTVGFKSAQYRDTFVMFIDKERALGGVLRFVAVQSVMVDKCPRVEFRYCTADAKITVRLLAQDQHGTWRIDRMNIE
jgi:hypothetical protein